MSFGMHTKSYVDNIEVKPGATWNRPAPKLALMIAVRCESVGPNTFTAGVCIGNRELARTSSHPDIPKAERAAVELIEAAYARLFSV